MKIGGKLLGKKEVFSKYWMELFLEDHLVVGKGEFEFVIVSAPNWAMTIPITNDEKFILIKQYRPAWRRVSYEFPGGRCIDNEEPIHTAKRELREEAGYTSNSWYHLLSAKPVTWTTQTMDIYVARELSFIGQDFDKEENIETIIVSEDQFLQLIQDEKILQSSTILAYNQWKLNSL